VAALVTRTLVDRDDPGFTHPTKPIGRYLPREQAQTLIDHGQVWEDRGEKGWRRVVASPEPLEVLDVGPVRVLLEAGHVVVAAGGGGIPVVREPDGRLRGVEAVIDKDLTAALLARTLAADVLVIATDVDHAAVDWGTPGQRELGRVTLAEMHRYAEEGQFASGSMGPKVEAATRFVAGGGPRSVITSLTHITDAVEGGFGTVIEPG
jgi:carbamate kinase